MTGEALQWPGLVCRGASGGCPRTLKKCPGFERVDAILIQPRDNAVVPRTGTLAAEGRASTTASRAAVRRLHFAQQLLPVDPGEARRRRKRRVQTVTIVPGRVLGHGNPPDQIVEIERRRSNRRENASSGQATFTI